MRRTTTRSAQSAAGNVSAVGSISAMRYAILAPVRLPIGGSMKYPGKRFKSLAVALKEIEPHIRDGKHLQTGKPFGNFSDMRSREVLANFLICAAANFENQSERFAFACM